MALITSPLFGLFGAAPVFDFNKIVLTKVVIGFLAITFFTFLIWAVNIVFLSFGNRFDFKGKDWVRYIASSIVCAIIFLVAYQVMPIKMADPVEIAKNLPKEFKLRDMPRPFGVVMPLLQSLSVNLVIGVLLEMMVLRDKKSKIEEENVKLRIFNIEARHSELKQRLHPHFLFNSLSTLGSLIKRSPDQAEKYLEKLAELLRFSISSESQTLIKLGEELELATNYLNMQKVRFGTALMFTVDIPSEMRSIGKVPVYSIQLLVENAIKHNKLTISRPLEITIKGDLNTQTVAVANNLQPKKQEEAGSKLGLSNLAERYRLLDNKEISVENSDHKFIVTIKVLGYESSYN